MHASLSEWIGFHLLIILLLGIDFVFYRKSRKIPLKKTLILSSLWLGAALLFFLYLLAFHGRENGIIFLTGYIVEEALSIDNLFVFLILFRFFQTPLHLVHDVLFWGVLGAILLRGIFISIGITLITHFQWILYVFGFFLIVIGVKLALEKEKKIHPEKNPFLRMIRRFFPLTDDYEKAHFFIRKRGVLFATPLFIVLVAVETTDIIFAFDSIPVIFGITQNPYLAYTSNIFAVLGLRSLYFVLSGLMSFFSYLHYGLSLILIFIGIKLLVSHWIIISVPITLGIILCILLGSMLMPRRV